MEKVKISVGKLVIPTYPEPAAEELPMFAENRVHQRSSGNPYPNKVVMEVNREEKIDKELDKIAHKVRKLQGKVKPSLKTRLLFYGLRLMQKKGINPVDAKYWKEKGWTAGKKPWKSTTLSIVEYKK